jgi:hypothetical protein
MSLLAIQQFGMLTIEKSRLEERLSKEVEPALAAENTKRNRKAKQDILDRLKVINREWAQIHRQMDAEVAAAAEAEERKKVEAAAKAEKDAKKAEGAYKGPKKPNGKSICCADCEQDFFFGKGEQAFYAEKGLAEPTRCRDCRAERKAARPQPLNIECCDCHENFEFSVGAQKHFEEQGWEQPVRCSDCRAAKKAAAPKPVLINCARCHADFTFSVGAQKHFKEQGWKSPVRCKKCREEHKSETSSRASTAGGGK